MAFCPYCGNNLEENAKFCSSCGANLNNNTTPEAIVFEKAQNKPRTLNVGMLVWSIINCLMCCMPLGVVSLIFTILAKDATDDEEEKKKLKVAKSCNIVNNVVIGLIAIVYVIIVIIGVAATTTAAL